jgi:putative hemolysin
MLIARESASVLLPAISPSNYPESQLDSLSLLPSLAPPASKRSFQLEAGPYIARLALTERERAEAYRLRFLVFNLELNEGLQSAYVDGYDKDHFDEVCDHLIVQERSGGAVVGTYRIQMGDVAGRNFGYYSEQEFCFAPYEAMRDQIVELGRACIHRDHRSSEVLHLLWRGIARYSLLNGGRYMMGCCSLPSLDPGMGYAVYESLRPWMTEPELQTVATAPFRMPAKTTEIPDVRAPKLLRAYLTIGAKICSEPAIDREFKTIDFLTILDLQTLHPRVAARFLEGC